MMKGGQTKPLSKLDVTTVTLQGWLDRYQKERGVQASTLATTKNNIIKVIGEEYLDRPLIDILEVFSQTDAKGKKKENPVKKALEDIYKKGILELHLAEEDGRRVIKDDLTHAKVSERKTLYSAFNNLRAQLKFSSEEPLNEEAFKGKSVEILGGVPKPIGSAKKVTHIKFRPELMGHRLHKMMEVVKTQSNEMPHLPEVFRTLDFQQHIGMRTDELLKMSPYDLKGPLGIEGGELPSIHMDRDFTKMAKDIDIPASPRVFHIFQQQLAYLEKNGLMKKHLPYLWVTADSNIVYNYKKTKNSPDSVDKKLLTDQGYTVVDTDDINLKGQSGFKKIGSADINYLNKASTVKITTPGGETIGILEDTNYKVGHPNRELFSLQQPREVRHMLTMIHDKLGISPTLSGQMLSRVIASGSGMWETYGGAGAGKARGMHAKEDVIPYKRASDKLLEYLSKLVTLDIPEGSNQKFRIADNIDLVRVAAGLDSIPIVEETQVKTPDGRDVPFTDVNYGSNQVFYNRTLKGSDIVGHTKTNYNAGTVDSITFGKPIVGSQTRSIDDVWKSDGTGESSASSSANTPSKKPWAERLAEWRNLKDKDILKMTMPFTLAPLVEGAWQVVDTAAGVGKALGAVPWNPITEGIGTAATLWDVHRLKQLPPEAWEGGQADKDKRIAATMEEATPYYGIPFLGELTYPTIEEQEKKDYWKDKSKQGFIDAREQLRIRNQPVQNEEEQSFLSEGQQQLN